MQQGLTGNLVTSGVSTVIVHRCYNLSKHFKVFCKGVQEHSDFTNEATEG